MTLKQIIFSIKVLIAGPLFMLTIGLAGASAHALAAPGMADITSSKAAVCQGVALAAGNCKTGGVDINTVLKGIITILSAVIGVAAVVMIIISGFRYITSGGDAQKVASAKSALIYAIVGLVIVALAQIIVHFVLSHSIAATGGGGKPGP